MKSVFFQLGSVVITGHDFPLLVSQLYLIQVYVDFFFFFSFSPLEQVLSLKASLATSKVLYSFNGFLPLSVRKDLS